jgi:hypothetical protein
LFALIKAGGLSHESQAFLFRAAGIWVTVGTRSQASNTRERNHPTTVRWGLCARPIWKSRKNYILLIFISFQKFFNLFFVWHCKLAEDTKNNLVSGMHIWSGRTLPVLLVSKII